MTMKQNQTGEGDALRVIHLVTLLDGSGFYYLKATAADRLAGIPAFVWTTEHDEGVRFENVADADRVAAMFNAEVLTSAVQEAR